MEVRQIVGSQKFSPSAPSGVLLDDDVHIGIEIETEGMGISRAACDKALSYWSVVLDGSLKSANPLEFVLCHPMSGETLVLALNEIREFFKKTKPQFPLNTSVHVHMNVGDLTLDQLRKIIEEETRHIGLLEEYQAKHA